MEGEVGSPFEFTGGGKLPIVERWAWDYRSQGYILVPGWNKHCVCGLVHAEDSSCCGGG